MHLTESHDAHLTESHMHIFNRITHVCIKELLVCILQNHTCMHLTESHMHIFNRITHVCI